MEASDAHRTANHQAKSKLKDRLDLGGGHGVSRGTPGITQQLSTGAREKSNRKRTDVKLLKKNDGRSGVGLSEKREAVPYAGGQRKVCGPLQKLAVLAETGHAPEKGPPSSRDRPEAIIII